MIRPSARPLVRRRLVAALIALAALALPLAAAAQPSELAVGQVWTIKATPPTPAKVVVGRLDTRPDGGVTVSVSVLDIPTERGPMGIGHLPFDKAALTASLDQLVATGQAPPAQFQPGYDAWRADPGGGVFTIPVAEVVASIVEQVRAAQSPQAAPAPPATPAPAPH